jgi:glucose-1-phosphate cytidylyltransferase
MKKYNYPVVILAGGQGTRLREETEFRPKPMVTIGGRPILWHIMKLYASFGFYRFIVCLGYKGEMIKNYFLNYHLEDIDFTINTKSGKITEHQQNTEEWEVTLVDTGEKCYTGGRVARIEKYIDTDRFLLTYGDGVSNVDIEKLITFHKSHGKTGTVTGVNPPSRFGNFKLEENKVVDFLEKQQVNDGWINGGFFVLEKSFFNYLSTEPTCVLEKDPIHNLALDKELMIYKHGGFWQCMDTIREHALLESLWSKTAPWKTWGERNVEK